MSSSIPLRLLEQQHLVKLSHQLNTVNYKTSNHKSAWHEKVTKITFTLIIAALSFSAVGCNTLQALEPTAILISDIKNVL